MASEAVTWGKRMGGSGEAGSTGALDSASRCGGVEATEGTVLFDRSSIICGDDLNDLDVLSPLRQFLNYNYFKFPNLDD